MCYKNDNFTGKLILLVFFCRKLKHTASLLRLFYINQTKTLLDKNIKDVKYPLALPGLTG